MYCIEHQLRAVPNRRNAAEYSPWQLTDVRISENASRIVRLKDHEYKGIVDEHRRPKMSYEIVKDTIFTSYDDYFETNL